MSTYFSIEIEKIVHTHTRILERKGPQTAFPQVRGPFHFFQAPTLKSFFMPKALQTALSTMDLVIKT